MHNRRKRVARLIKSEVSEMILKELKDPRIGFVSVTNVEVSGDLRHATVFYTVHGGEKAVKATQAALDHATGYIKREIGRRLYLRYVPEMRFKYDDVFERAWHLEEVFRDIHRVDGPTASASDEEPGRAGDTAKAE